MIFKPRMMTIHPETRLIYLNRPSINLIVDDKITLKTIKTRLKPKIKLIVPAIGLGLSALPAGGELPITHRYDGISGSTQGDKKDKSPAPNAIKTDIFSAIYIILPYLWYIKKA